MLFKWKIHFTYLQILIIIKKIFKEQSIDNTLLTILNKKFPHIKIDEDYDKNILKIETLFTETYNQKIIIKIVDEIIEKVINEQVLL